MRPGISSYTYTWAIGVPGCMPDKSLSAYGLIEKAAEYGLKVVQIADNLPLEQFTEGEKEQLYKYSVSKGITLEMGGRGLTPGHTMECLLTAEKIGSSLLRMVTDFPGFEPEINEIISIIRGLLPEFVSRGIALAIENHDRLKARDFEKIITSVGSEFVGICLDSVNSMGAGEGFDNVCDILVPYTINLHVKDFTICRQPHKMGFIIEGTPAGKGMLDIEELAGKINAYGRCKTAILELWTPPEPSLNETIRKEETWVAESITFLKNVLG
jgi:3-oxoisoapionate decarboxylase